MTSIATKTITMPETPSDPSSISGLTDGEAKARHTAEGFIQEGPDVVGQQSPPAIQARVA